MMIPIVVFASLILILQIAIDPENFINYFGIYVVSFVVTIFTLVSIPVFMFGLPLSKIKKHTPEHITLSPDRIKIDDQIFFFSQIKLIKVTPHEYQGFFRFKRKITIIEANKTSMFIVGDSTDANPIWEKKGKPKIFKDYKVFCEMLEAALVNEKDKFIHELM